MPWSTAWLRLISGCQLPRRTAAARLLLLLVVVGPTRRDLPPSSPPPTLTFRSPSTPHARVSRPSHSARATPVRPSDTLPTAHRTQPHSTVPAMSAFAVAASGRLALATLTTVASPSVLLDQPTTALAWGKGGGLVCASADGIRLWQAGSLEGDGRLVVKSRQGVSSALSSSAAGRRRASGPLSR
jgi:hypothetical protein